MDKKELNISLFSLAGCYLIVSAFFVISTYYVEVKTLSSGNWFYFAAILFLCLFFIISGVSLLYSSAEWAVGIGYMSLSVKILLSTYNVFSLAVQNPFTKNLIFSIPENLYGQILFYTHSGMILLDLVFLFLLIKNEF